jgi:multiple sugar transport system permease protein
VLTAGGPNYATTTIVYLIYTTAFTTMDLGYASSIAYILFAVILLVTLAQYRVLNRDVTYG